MYFSYKWEDYLNALHNTFTGNEHGSHCPRKWPPISSQRHYVSSSVTVITDDIAS